MIAASVKDAEPIVELLLSRGASVDQKSMCICETRLCLL